MRSDVAQLLRLFWGEASYCGTSLTASTPNNSWQPAAISCQQSGRVDQIGPKAELSRLPIHVYLPFITATQDENMFRVVRDREQ